MRAGERSIRRVAPAALQRGFTYVWVLAAIVVMSLGLAAIGPRWADQARREHERELLQIGSLYAKAIAAYYRASPGSLKQYPAKLEDLLVDTRMVGTVRHLRKLYPDPLDPSRAWGVLRGSDGRIRGVYSQSEDEPLRIESLELDSASLAAARRYSDWKFIAKVQP